MKFERSRIVNELVLEAIFLYNILKFQADRQVLELTLLFKKCLSVNFRNKKFQIQISYRGIRL